MNLSRYTLLLVLSGSLNFLNAGGSQSALMIKEDEERIQHLPNNLKQEYRSFKKAYHATRKYKEKVCVQALALNRNLRKAEQEKLALDIESLMSTKYQINFARFQGCRNSSYLDRFNFRQMLNDRYTFEEWDESLKNQLISTLQEGADINYQQELILSREDMEFHENGVRFIRHEKKFAGNTSLILAAYHGYYSVVQYLLKAGIDQYIQTGNGCDALFFAECNIEADKIKDLLKGRTAEEETELVNKNKVKIQQLLRAELSKKALIAEGFKLHKTYMPQALQDIILTYAAHYAPIKEENKITETEEKKEQEIIAAANFEHPEETAKLSELQQKRIDTEIVAAIKRNGVLREEIYEMLERGAHVDAQDSMGHTPLMLAIIFNRPDIFDTVLTCIKNSSSPLKYLLMEDNAGNSAHKLAQHYKRDSMVAQLIHAGIVGE